MCKYLNKRFYLSISCIIIIVAGWVISSGDDKQEVPDYILGEYTSNDSRYEDREFIIDKEKVSFIVEGEDVHGGNIEKVKMNIANDTQLFDFDYKDNEGVEFKLSFLYDKTDGGTIKMQNQDGVQWRRKWAQ